LKVRDVASTHDLVNLINLETDTLNDER